MKKSLNFLVVSFFLYASPALGAKYELDQSHTHVGFSIKHLVITNVKGHFTDFSGEFEFDEKSKKLESAKTVIKTVSINTNNEKRDKHLRSPDFFDVAKYPEMIFTLKSSKTSGNDLVITGDLIMHGVTKQVKLEGEFLGAVNDPWGNHRVAFTFEGKINRFDFGLTWSKMLEAGGLVVGDKVKIILEVEAILKKNKE